MHLVQEPPDFEFFLRGADGASALVNQRQLTRSFIIAPNQMIEDWPAKAVDQLDVASINAMLALKPEVVILGTGGAQDFPSAEVMATCLQQGIGIECMTNAAAARTFNVLAGEGRRVVAGFLLPG